MIDHVSLYVKDFPKSKAFYEKALAPVGYTLMKEFDGKAGGFGKENSDLWIIEREEVTPQHLALRVEKREDVDGFYREALAAGGKDNGAPGIRKEYGDNYYAAFVFDPDGHNFEVVCYTNS